VALRLPGYPPAELLYLPRADVVRACEGIDVVEVVTAAMRQHADGATLLPDEAYLGWQTPDGAAARSLAMPGGIGVDGDLVLGLKIINASLANPARGLARAEGLILLFDPHTARPRVMMEAAHISALRTAALTASTARRLGVAGLRRAAVVGCGALARAHLLLLPRALPALDHVALYDLDPGRRGRLADDLRAEFGDRLAVVECGDVRDCVRGAGLVVTVTTATEGYIGLDWLAPGAVVAHVSLDDVLPEVVERADLLVVDDWDLISQDHRRLLGRMYHAGQLRSPDGSYHPDSTPVPGARQVDASIGDVLTGRHPGRRDDREIVLSNPFGMSILDIAVAHEVLQAAQRNGAGITLQV
jgi:ornithine cyclodeaminase